MLRSRATVVAPLGKLGIILANRTDARGTVMSGVRTSSVLAEQVGFLVSLKCNKIRNFIKFQQIPRYFVLWLCKYEVSSIKFQSLVGETGTCDITCTQPFFFQNFFEGV